MDKQRVYIGIGMLLAPFIFILITNITSALIDSGINLLGLSFAVCVISYIGVALYLIVTGANKK